MTPVRDPLDFVRRGLAPLPDDPAEASAEDLPWLRQIAAALDAIADQTNLALDEAWRELEAYFDRVPGVHSGLIVVRSTTTVTKQDPPAKKAQR